VRDLQFIVTEGMGWLEVVTGSMFSGKSEELIKRLRRSKYARQKVVAFKHASDVRYDDAKLASHSQSFIEGVPVGSVEEMKKIFFEKYSDAQVIGIDEVQFFGGTVVKFCEDLADMGKRVIVAGLDKDFKGEPFKPMDELLARAEYVDKFQAICAVCGNPATVSQRLIDGEPAYYDDPIVLVGATESYEPRCRKCHRIRYKDENMGNIYFIVGTGTEIGKTHVTIKLIEEDLKNKKNVMALKPIETGLEIFGENLEGSDTKKYADLLGKNVEEINTYFFKKPMSPHIAADLDGKQIFINQIKKRIDEETKVHETLYVEGAGGLLVPYKDRYTYLDLLVDYRKKSEVIVVANNSLGTINHTLLTIETLKRNDIMIKGIVFNNKDNNVDEILLKNNVDTIEKLSGIKVLKNIRHDGGTGEF
jgi:thymidine kinase